MKHKRALSLFLSIVMIMMLVFETSAYVPAAAAPSFSAEAAEIRTTVDEYSGIETRDSHDASGFKLGSEPDSILYGAPEEIIVINEDGTESAILVANLNDFRSKKLFTRFEDGKASICTYDPETREIATMLETGSAEITHMFAINEEYIEYLAGNVVYRYYPDTGISEKLAAPADVFSFVPTSFGNFYSAGSSVDAELYFESTHLLSGVTWYTVDDAMLLLTADYEDYQIEVAGIASYCNAPTRSSLLDLMEPYEFYGLVPVSDILNMDDDHECAHCADEAEHMNEERDVEQTDESTLDYKGGTSMPLNDLQREIINRATEIVGFKWTPVKDLGKITGYDANGDPIYYFRANKQQTGIPYMRPGSYKDSYGNWTTPYQTVYLTFEKFKNENTMSTLAAFRERVKDQADDIFKAHQTYGSSGSSGYYPLYGLDCSAFVSYAWEISRHASGMYGGKKDFFKQLTSYPFNVDTATMPSYRITTADLNKLQPCDAFISASCHVILVTAINKNGNTIVSIETMEETPPKAVRKVYYANPNEGELGIQQDLLNDKLLPEKEKGKAKYHPYNIFRYIRLDAGFEAKIGYVTGGSLGLYMERNTTSTLLCNIPNGTELEVWNLKEGWYATQYNKRLGYVRADRIVVTGSPTPTPTPPPTPTPTPTPASIPATGYVKTQTDPLNMRAQPDRNSTIRTKIPKGASFELLARTGDWFKACYNNKTGYVLAQYVGFAARVSTSGGDLNLREQGNTSSTIIIPIPNRTELLVWNLDNGWYQAEYNGKTGYVSADYITPITNRPKVTVTLQPKGSVVSPSTITVAVGQKYGTLPEPAAREGYRFTGWYLGGTQITANSNVQNSSNHILTGKWKYIGSVSPQGILPDELINKSGNSIIEGE